MTDTASTREELRELRADFQRLREAVRAVFLGQEAVVDLLLYSILADGHCLLEGAPGLGKTTLVRTVARALGLKFGRVQFTPDLMPADILGLRMLELDESGARHFTFQRGPVFTNVLLADEINRATPRTQSALLEAMQEHQVTLSGETHPLEEPFIVMATQNPIEMEGTYPLPEAQLDRFLLKVELRSPGLAELVEILGATTEGEAGEVEAVVGRSQVLRMRELVRGVPASSDVVELAARTVLLTHPDAEGAPPDVARYVRYGSSPRGGQAMLLTAKARALVGGRLHASVEDLAAVVAPALRHRLILGYEGEAAGAVPDRLAETAFEAARRA